LYLVTQPDILLLEVADQGGLMELVEVLRMGELVEVELEVMEMEEISNMLPQGKQTLEVEEVVGDGDRVVEKVVQVALGL
jgi:hypothetical protein